MHKPKAENQGILKKIWPVIGILLVTFIFALPYFTKGRVPFPSRYLVTFFPPWNASYAMPVKNGAMPDVITQIFPWKRLTISTWKLGQVPLWNPYSFSGTAQAANYQTAVFSPINLLFFILPEIHAWSIMILLQPLLAAFFMFLFLRELGLTRKSSLLGALSFMFCGFMVVWMAYGTLGYAAIFLPLILFAAHRFIQRGNSIYGMVVSLGVALSFFSGHFQISLYVYMCVCLYSGYLILTTKKMKYGVLLIVFLIIGLLLCAPQLMPSFEAYAGSVRMASFGKGEVIPWKYLVTLLAPDFYGNPVTRNDWFGHYAEWASFIGVIPLLLASYSVYYFKDRKKLFFIVAALACILLAYDTLFVDLLYKFKIPVLSTSAASRIILLFSFSMCSLAGLGLDQLVADWKQKKYTQIYVQAIFWGVLIGVVWFLLKAGLLLPQDKSMIATRNLILPTVLLAGGISMFFVGLIKNKTGVFLQRVVPIILISITALEGLRFASKWLPFEEQTFVYPRLPLIQELQQKVHNDRVFGNIGGEVADSFSLQNIEGYDAVYQSRYGQFISSVTNGNIAHMERSVVQLDKYGKYTQDLLDLVGVKFLVHRLSDGRNVWAYPYWNYPQYTSVYKDGTYEVFENTKALPRAFLASDYIVKHTDAEILSSVWSSSTNRQNTVVLETEPEYKPASGSGQATIIRYTPSRIDISTESIVPKLLFLSDVYDKGWKAQIDGNEVEVLRTDYAFRSVSLPSGVHHVTFYYDPKSYRRGVQIAVFGVILLFLAGLCKKMYEHRNI
jgi:hypothetical protein